MGVCSLIYESVRDEESGRVGEGMMADSFVIVVIVVIFVSIVVVLFDSAFNVAFPRSARASYCKCSLSFLLSPTPTMVN